MTIPLERYVPQPPAVFPPRHLEAVRIFAEPAPAKVPDCPQCGLDNNLSCWTLVMGPYGLPLELFNALLRAIGDQHPNAEIQSIPDIGYRILYCPDCHPGEVDDPAEDNPEGRVTGVCAIHGRRYDDPPIPCPDCHTEEEDKDDDDADI